MYLIRLDDAAHYMDNANWIRIEKLMDKYHIKPIVAVIPDVRDRDFCDKYSYDAGFWEKVSQWEKKGWTIGLHGLTHELIPASGGLNPVNDYSEFVGKPLSEQSEIINDALSLFFQKSIHPKVFIAPAHSYDSTTLEALRLNSEIRIISDSIAWDVYFSRDFYYVPQQSGKVRDLPFALTTFCYHPNTMNDCDFDDLEKFLNKKQSKFGKLDNSILTLRNKSFLDKLLSWSYFGYRRAIKKIKSKNEKHNR